MFKTLTMHKLLNDKDLILNFMFKTNSNEGRF